MLSMLRGIVAMQVTKWRIEKPKKLAKMQQQYAGTFRLTLKGVPDGQSIKNLLHNLDNEKQDELFRRGLYRVEAGLQDRYVWEKLPGEAFINEQWKFHAQLILGMLPVLQRQQIWL